MSAERLAPRPFKELIDLLSSMRFAITLLTVICIASMIGTVVEQRQPFGDYVNQFGPFWAAFFGKVGLFTVYGAWWFVLILAFLVLSTSLCIARNAPKIVKDLRSYKEHVREQSLQAHHHKALGELPVAPLAALPQISSLLDQLGWKARAQIRQNGIMVAARRGAANKIGYLCAHSAIVLICLGGLSDGDMILRGLMLIQGKTVYSGSGPVLEKNVLPPGNPSFRGSIEVVEGAHNGTAQLSLADGVVLQQLPFDIELKKFTVDFYTTGMPKLFASQVVLHEHGTGATTEATVKVNEPLIHDGIAIYQSSFSDGGSNLKLTAEPMGPKGEPFQIENHVGGNTRLNSDEQALTLEFTNLRVMNVENLGKNDAAGTDARKVDFVSSLQNHLGSGAKGKGSKELHNIGPSFSYKLRDAAGQAREYNNYVAPVELDGQTVFLAGVRDTPAEEFRYLRIPADDRLSMDSWLRLRRALVDPELRDRAARRYAQSATPPDKPQMLPELTATTRRTLGLFAGVEGVKRGDKLTPGASGGLPALSDFVDQEVPEKDRQRVSEVLLRILNGSLFELLQISRSQAGLDPAPVDAATQKFMIQSVLALSDSMYYPAPVLLRLDDFKQIQASVFQVARAPGKKIVYLGAAFLIIGVFAMLFVKERRVWIWLEHAPGHADATRVRMAFSSTRESPDTVAEFEQLRAALLKEEGPP
ncbi:MAG TPA: cytochrome c biogenesis protein ResB [Burkholderiaceae bacterium]